MGPIDLRSVTLWKHEWFCLHGHIVHHTSTNHSLSRVPDPKHWLLCIPYIAVKCQFTLLSFIVDLYTKLKLEILSTHIWPYKQLILNNQNTHTILNTGSLHVWYCDREKNIIMMHFHTDWHKRQVMHCITIPAKWHQIQWFDSVHTGSKESFSQQRTIHI